MENIWLELNELGFKERISVKSIWYLTISKIQVEFDNEIRGQFGQELWPLINMKLQIFGFR